MKSQATHAVRPKMRTYAAISASALSRLVWATGALALLWLAVYWALS